MRMRTFLLVLLLAVTASVKAQTTLFDWEENSPVRTDTTVAAATVAPTVTEATKVTVTTTSNDTVIGETEYTWKTLGETLQTKFYEFAGTADSVISKNSISWIFKVKNVPLKTGASTLYLCMVGNGDNKTYFVTCTDPNSVAQVRSCNYELPQGRKHTDDPSFEQKPPTGPNRVFQRGRQPVYH